MKAQPGRENPAEGPRPSCQGTTPAEESCEAPGTVYCERCEQWFCEAHAEDDTWHACVLEEGEEGGEG